MIGQADPSIRQTSFASARRTADVVNEQVRQTSDALNAFLALHPRGPMNLTPDHVKAMPEFKTLDLAYARAFAKARAYNAWFTKEFKREYAAAIKAERQAKMAALV